MAEKQYADLDPVMTGDEITVPEEPDVPEPIGEAPEVAEPEPEPDVPEPIGEVPVPVETQPFEPELGEGAPPPVEQPPQLPDVAGGQVYTDPDTGQQQYIQGSTMYEMGFRTPEEHLEAQQAGVSYGVHEGELVPEQSVLVEARGIREYPITVRYSGEAGAPEGDGISQSVLSGIARGDYFVPMDTGEGITYMTAKEAQQANLLEGKDQFDYLKQIGVIKPDSVYLHSDTGWMFMPSSQLKEIRENTPELYDVLMTQGYEAYQAQAEDLSGRQQQVYELQSEAYDIAQAKYEKDLAEYEADLVAFRTELATMPEELQYAYEVGGIAGFNTAVEDYNQRVNEENQKIDTVMAGLRMYTVAKPDDYPGEVPDKSYDLAKFLRDKPEEEGALLAVFSQEDVDKAKEYNLNYLGIGAPAYIPRKEFAEKYFEDKGWIPFIADRADYIKGYFLSKGWPEYTGLPQASMKTTYREPEYDMVVTMNRVNEANEAYDQMVQVQRNKGFNIHRGTATPEEIRVHHKRMLEAIKAHDRAFTAPMSASDYTKRYFGEQGWKYATNLSEASQKEFIEHNRRLREANAEYERRYGLKATVESGLGRSLGFIFVPARAISPEIKASDLSTRDWILGGAQLALVAAPVLGIVGKAASLAVRPVQFVATGAFIADTATHFGKMTPVERTIAVGIDLAITGVVLRGAGVGRIFKAPARAVVKYTDTLAKVKSQELMPEILKAMEAAGTDGIYRANFRTAFDQILKGIQLKNEKLIKAGADRLLKLSPKNVDPNVARMVSNGGKYIKANATELAKMVDDVAVLRNSKIGQEVKFDTVATDGLDRTYTIWHAERAGAVKRRLAESIAETRRWLANLEARDLQKLKVANRQKARKNVEKFTSEEKDAFLEVLTGKKAYYFRDKMARVAQKREFNQMWQKRMAEKERLHRQLLETKLKQERASWEKLTQAEKDRLLEKMAKKEAGFFDKQKALREWKNLQSKIADERRQLVKQITKNKSKEEMAEWRRLSQAEQDRLLERYAKHEAGYFNKKKALAEFNRQQSKIAQERQSLQKKIIDRKLAEERTAFNRMTQAEKDSALERLAKKEAGYFDKQQSLAKFKEAWQKEREAQAKLWEKIREDKLEAELAKLERLTEKEKNAIIARYKAVKDKIAKGIYDAEVKDTLGDIEAMLKSEGKLTPDVKKRLKDELEKDLKDFDDLRGSGGKGGVAVKERVKAEPKPETKTEVETKVRESTKTSAPSQAPVDVPATTLAAVGYPLAVTREAGLEMPVDRPTAVPLIRPEQQPVTAKAPAQVAVQAPVDAPVEATAPAIAPEPEEARSVIAPRPVTAVVETPSPAPTPQPRPKPAPAPEHGKPPVPPIRPKRPFPTPRLGKGEGVGTRERLPDGSVAFAFGKRKGIVAQWYYIPPPYDQRKPVSLDAPPEGAVNTGSYSPYDTIQVIGDSSRVPEFIDIDLGITDAHITNAGRTIAFGGKGQKTNVGERIESTTTGMDLMPDAVTLTEGRTLRRSDIKRAVKKAPPKRKKNPFEDLVSLKGMKY